MADALQHGAGTAEANGPLTAPAQERSYPAIAVATAAEAALVRAALDEAAVAAEIRIGAIAHSPDDEPLLVVGSLLDDLGGEELSRVSWDFLPAPFTSRDLAFRLRVLADRWDAVSAQRSEAADQHTIVRTIADAVRVAVLFYDEHDRPLLHNKMVEEILALTGYDPATGVSAHVYSPDRRTPVKQGKDIVSETLHGDDRGVIYWVGDPDRDKQRAVITEAVRIKRPDGTALGSAVLSYDITDLANAIEAREDYLANVTHELRTPLTAIVGYVDLIAETYNFEELGFQHELGIIQRNLDQLTSLVNDLSVAGDREQNLRIEPVDLGSLVSHSVSALQPTADAAKLQIESDLPPSSLIALVDATRVRQILDNLVANAVKYTPPRGRIEVSLRRHHNEAIVRITNTGSGLTTSDQARVFDRFFRSQEARESAARGIGIGLPIAKALAEAHGGSIAVDSVLGESTTFTLSLPLRQEGAPLSSFPEEP